MSEERSTLPPPPVSGNAAQERKRVVAGLFDRAAPSYEQTGVPFFDPLGRMLVERARPLPGERVLDVGCGRGASLFPAAEAVGPTGAVTGLDIAPGMVNATAAEAHDRGLTWVRVALGDAEAPDLPPGAFDVVQAGLVVFFLPDAASAVRCWAALLRPGGRIVLSTFVEPTDDERAFYATVGATLGPFLPPATTPTPAPTGTSPNPVADQTRTRDWVAGLLAPAGFTDLRFEEVVLRSVVSGPEAFWDFMMSSGMRGTLEAIPQDRRPAARDALTRVVAERLAQPDGTYAMDSPVRFTTAVLRS